MTASYWMNLCVGMVEHSFKFREENILLLIRIPPRRIFGESSFFAAFELGSKMDEYRRWWRIGGSRTIINIILTLVALITMLVIVGIPFIGILVMGLRRERSSRGMRLVRIVGRGNSDALFSRHDLLDIWPA